jgi:hypothetical protein
VTSKAGVDNRRWGCSTTFLDYDRDGWLDLFVSNYLQLDPDDLRSLPCYLVDEYPFCQIAQFRGQPSVLYHNNRDFQTNDSTPNFLFKNLGDGRLRDVALEANVGFAPSGNATGAMSADAEDVDGDGRLDLLVTNFNYQGTFLHCNTGNMTFADRGGPLGLAASTFGMSSFGTRFLDYDNDGDPDVLLFCVSQPPRLLRNDGGNRRHWLGVKLVGTKSSREAIGAKVRMTAGGRIRMRSLVGGASYLSASDTRLLFGLGEAERVDELEVRWPSGHLDRVGRLRADRYVTVAEGLRSWTDPYQPSSPLEGRCRLQPIKPADQSRRDDTPREAPEASSCRRLRFRVRAHVK